jgi:protocatechuate 3,4-dioxygenase beta subunit
MTTPPPETDHDDFGGLHRDLPQVLDRRRAIQWMGGVSLAGLLAACGSNDTTASAATTESTENATSLSTPASDSTQATNGAEIPDETAGPYPADGSNGPNVLSEDGIVRSDLTTSVGSLSGTATGIPTSIELSIVDADTGDPMPGAAVYLWHCTAAGQYSMYEITDQNYLRGVQAADDAGKVTFTTIFPGCYPGRWPHCHFEVYESLDLATAGSQATKVSQLALPQADCEAVYADTRYGDSAANLGRLSLSTDNVFSDGWGDQLATVAGNADELITASLLVRV